MTSDGPASKLYTAKTLRQTVEKEDFDFEEEFPQDEGPPEAPVTVREYSDWIRSKVCSVCGQEKEPYVEVEVDGEREFTCRSCFEAGGAPAEPSTAASCPSCGEPIEPDDRFCGKCGTAAILSCPSCGAERAPDDRFCGKCGASL
jgi:predicted nucleic acid-binding Zn ribbon protein